MVKLVFDKESEEKEEMFSDVDVSQVLKMLRLQAMNKLKELSERAGRRTISELNQIIDSTELMNT